MSRIRASVTCIVCLVVILALFSPPVRADGAFTRGDVNGDGLHDISDPIRLLDEIFLMGAPVPCDDASDADDDGTKSVADVIYLLGYLFDGGASPPPPFGECGTDPTDDALGCDQSTGSCLPPPPAELSLVEPPRWSPSVPSRALFRPSRPGEGEHVAPRSVLPFSGEFAHQEVDLKIPGRGFDFEWARTYRSRVPTDGKIGNGWDFSYNIFVEEVAGGILIHDGNGRQYLLSLQLDGTYAADGFFHTGTLAVDGVFTLQFANHGTWVFQSLDPTASVPAPGHIASIADRHGNTMTFEYDDLGNLIQVTDTLLRVITVTYDALGRIAAVTDFTGRTVSYEYYGPADVLGGPGDLQSMTTPSVVGTPHSNDYPAGKITVYGYSTGFADERLNSNLTTITNPKGLIYLQNTYGTSGVNFDRVTRQVLGGPSQVIDMVYVPNPSEPGAVMLVVINDRRGLVTQNFYDSSNRCILKREFTGFAVPNLPTSTSTNLPINPLRPFDPAFFDTRYEWNQDSLLTRIVHSKGNETLFTYELAVNPAAPRHARGNLRLKQQIPGIHVPVGDQAQLTDEYEYEPGYGGYDAALFTTFHRDPRGNETLHLYDVDGNRIETTHRISSIVENFEYNSFGQLTAHVHPSSAPAPTIQRRRDEFCYFSSGPQRGYPSQMVIDALGFALTTQYDYDAVGNRIQEIDPNGHQTDLVFNELNQVVREILPELTLSAGLVRYERDHYYDANNNRVRTDVQNIDSSGSPATNSHLTTLQNFDLLDNVTEICREVGSFDVPPDQLTCDGLPSTEFVSRGFQHDPNENVSLILNGEAMNGSQPSNVVNQLHDERNLVFRSARGSAGAPLTTQFDYDPNGNLSRRLEGLESNPRETMFTYDAYERLMVTVDAMGNEESCHYDPNGNVVSRLVEGEILDGPGGGALNVRLAESDYVYDPMDRLVSQSDHHFALQGGQPPIGDGFKVTQFSYVDTSQPLAVVDDNNHQTSRTYDSASRESVVTDAAGNQMVTSYDANSNAISRTQTEVPSSGGPAEVFVDSFTYDALNRPLSRMDNLGNTTVQAYDSRGNVTREIDPRGNVVTRSYDGMDRLLAETREMTDTGVGGGSVVGQITTSTVWDDSSRLIMRTDDNGNDTAHLYDEYDRLTATVFADGTVESFLHDVHDNVIFMEDGNGSQVLYGHDLLNRNTVKEVSSGPGVSNDTTYELYGFDGLSRVVSAEDDDSQVTREYDSLSNVTTEEWPLTGGVVARGYDGVGNELSLSYPGGRSVGFSYDVLNRKAQAFELPMGINIASYEYIGPGRVDFRQHANNTRLSYAYDGARNVVGTTSEFDPTGTPSVIDQRTYSWDANYNKLGRQAGSLTHDYVYDSINRLVETHVADSDGPIRDTLYSLDGVGNRTSVVDGECAGPYTMNPSVPPSDAHMNQYTTTGCDPLRNYDENGNLVGVGVAGLPSALYEFDYRDQLVEYYDGPTDLTTTYAYDPFGRLIRTQTQSPTGGPGFFRNYYYDTWQIIEEQNDLGVAVQTYVYGNGIDEVIQKQGIVSTLLVNHYYHPDDLGNVMALSDGGGSPAERYDYSDYGTPSFFDAAGGPQAGSSVGNPYLFNGRRFDSASGLYYYRTRFLEPDSGRFISRDLIGIWGDAGNLGNGCTYVGNNPWTFTDPMGLFNPQPEPPAMPMDGLMDPLSSVAEVALNFTPDPAPPPNFMLRGPEDMIRPVGFNPRAGASLGARDIYGSGWDIYQAGADTYTAGWDIYQAGVDTYTSGWDVYESGRGGRGLLGPRSQGARTGSAFESPLSWFFFNPQPEPPQPEAGAVDPLGSLSFNPQPEPPRIRSMGSGSPYRRGGLWWSPRAMAGLRGVAGGSHEGVIRDIYESGIGGGAGLLGPRFGTTPDDNLGGPGNNFGGSSSWVGFNPQPEPPRSR